MKKVPHRLSVVDERKPLDKGSDTKTGGSAVVVLEALWSELQAETADACTRHAAKTTRAKNMSEQNCPAAREM